MACGDLNPRPLGLKTYTLPTALTSLSVTRRFQGRKGVDTSQDACPSTYDGLHTYYQTPNSCMKDVAASPTARPPFCSLSLQAAVVARLQSRL